MTLKTKLIFIIVLCIGLSACVSKKPKGDISKTKRFWHNTTSLYNGYFNAREIMELTLLKMEEQSQDNYTQILPIYHYQKISDSKTFAQDLDKAIEKVARVNSLHGPSYWIDDCYVLMGQAQYLKRDFESAEETFEFFKEEFEADNIYSSLYTKKAGKGLSKAQKKKERKLEEKARDAERKEKEKIRKEEKKARDKARKEAQKAKEKEKKEREKAKKRGERLPIKDKTIEDKSENSVVETKEKEEKIEDKKEKEDYKKGLFGHAPAYYEGMLWLAKTYIERERFSAAEAILRRIDQTEVLAKEDQRELASVYADLNLKKGDYNESIKQLDLAIDLAKTRKRKARLTYIKAQVYEELNQMTSALAEYDRVKSYSPNFEMEFNADLNKIRLNQTTGSLTSDRAIKNLDKMFKQEKYSFYHADIFNAIGEIKKQTGDLEGATYAFQQSIKRNDSNLPLKIETYYKLAEMFYDAEAYAQAKYYYDSTTMVMTKSDKRFEESKKLSENLTLIAQNIEVIEGEKANLAMGNMSKEELRALAVSRILEKNKNGTPGEAIANNAISIPSGGSRLNVSNFFAYNPITLNKGIDEFKRKWGDRQLADNWRNSSTATNFGDNEKESFSESDITEKQIQDELKTIPQSKIQQDLAKLKIQEAMFDLGKLYREKLNNSEKSLLVHEELYTDYPDFKQEEELLFYMYLASKDLGKNAKANKYKKLLADKYPNSKFSLILSQPGYAEKIQENTDNVEKFYEDTYSLFELSKHKGVIQRSEKALELYPAEKEYQPKFALLSAMSKGKVQDKKEYIVALSTLVKKYPGTKEQVRASEILRFLKGDEDAFNPAIADEAANAFVRDSSNLHYGLIVFYKVNDEKVTAIKKDITDYHKKYNKLDRLSMSNITLNEENESELILIRKFDDEETAMKYYSGISAKRREYIKQRGISFEHFILTQSNYREVIKKRSVSEYRSFFEKNY